MRARTRNSASVLIVGGGIGGLTTALALRRAGIDSIVVEQAPELREVGAGISLWPNAINSLRRLGLGAAVEGAGCTVTESHTRSWRGALLHSLPVSQLETRFGAPLVMIHRAALHAALLDPLDEDMIRLDSRCVGLEQDDERARIHLADGTVLTGLVAVGADGLRSVVRSMMLGDGPPRSLSLRSWRAVATVDPSLADQVSTGESWGRGSVFGAQRLPHGQVYWYAAARAGEGDPITRGTEKQDLLHRFSDWHSPIRNLIDATENDAILRNDLFDRPAPRSLAFGRVALLGDAAHPMLPYLGQGACQAIVDGETLAEALSEDVGPRGLDVYSRRRVAPVVRAVVQSRRMAQVAHIRNPVGVGLRRALLRTTSTKATLSRLGPIVGGTPSSADLHPSEARS
jgi:2-polyprenyl-6-methoxyphenol hydroxylase-like FAD-dependent oxidoreductase